MPASVSRRRMTRRVSARPLLRQDSCGTASAAGLCADAAHEIDSQAATLHGSRGTRLQGRATDHSTAPRRLLGHGPVADVWAVAPSLRGYGSGRLMSSADGRTGNSTRTRSTSYSTSSQPSEIRTRSITAL